MGEENINEYEKFILHLLTYYAGINIKSIKHIKTSELANDLIEFTIDTGYISIGELTATLDDSGRIEVYVDNILKTELHKVVLRSTAFQEVFLTNMHRRFGDRLSFALWNTEEPRIEAILQKGIGTDIDKGIKALHDMLNNYVNLVVSSLIEDSIVEGIIAGSQL